MVEASGQGGGLDQPHTHTHTHAHIHDCLNGMDPVYVKLTTGVRCDYSDSRYAMRASKMSFVLSASWLDWSASMAT